MNEALYEVTVSPLSMSSFPPTLIILHPNENRRKCTVRSLRHRADLDFRNWPIEDPFPLDDFVRLGIGGSPLGPADRDRGLLVLDGSWRHAARMERDFAHVPLRSLPPWKTAYPRISKLFVDPKQGLATIEAIYVAYLLLGRDTTGLLDGYRWAQQFLDINGITQ